MKLCYHGYCTDRSLQVLIIVFICQIFLHDAVSLAYYLCKLPIWTAVVTIHQVCVFILKMLQQIPVYTYKQSQLIMRKPNVLGTLENALTWTDFLYKFKRHFPHHVFSYWKLLYNLNAYNFYYMDEFDPACVSIGRYS